MNIHAFQHLTAKLQPHIAVQSNGSPYNLGTVIARTLHVARGDSHDYHRGFETLARTCGLNRLQLALMLRQAGASDNPTGNKPWRKPPGTVWQAFSRLTSAAPTHDQNLNGMNLFGADLAGASLSGCSLVETILSCTNLKGADLSRCHFEFANLDNTNLEDANLSLATFDHTSLQHASLKRAHVRNPLPQLQPQRHPHRRRLRRPHRPP